MPKPVTVIRIRSGLQSFARMSILPSIPNVRRLVGVTDIGHQVLLDEINGEKLILAGPADLQAMSILPGWRIRGGQTFRGNGILFGSYKGRMDGMWHSPIDVDWCARMIEWVAAGE